MKRIVNIASNHKDAKKHDIDQQRKMTAEERHLAAKELKRRYYGENPVDIRKSGYYKIK